MPFTYGHRSEYQIFSLAVHSSRSYQSIMSHCDRQNKITHLIGADGTEIPVTESSETLVRTIEVENNCEVSFQREEKRKFNNEQMRKGRSERVTQ